MAAHRTNSCNPRPGRIGVQHGGVDLVAVAGARHVPAVDPGADPGRHPVPVDGLEVGSLRLFPPRRRIGERIVGPTLAELTHDTVPFQGRGRCRSCRSEVPAVFPPSKGWAGRRTIEPPPGPATVRPPQHRSSHSSSVLPGGRPAGPLRCPLPEPTRRRIERIPECLPPYARSRRRWRSPRKSALHCLPLRRQPARRLQGSREMKKGRVGVS